MLRIKPHTKAVPIPIFGVAFTSRPSRRKPITVARAILGSGHLHVAKVDCIASWQEFESFLQEPGPWRAGFDFPFSQPLRLFKDFGLKGDWEPQVHALTSSGRQAYEHRLRAYMDAQPYGDKQHFRLTDRRSNSCSPMKLDFTPVGKMFFEGAPRLIAAGLSILPCRPTNGHRVAVEAYPKLVAKKYIGLTAYKSEKKPGQTEVHRMARRHILLGLDDHAQRDYGITIGVSPAPKKGGRTGRLGRHS